MKLQQTTTMQVDKNCTTQAPSVVLVEAASKELISTSSMASNWFKNNQGL